MFSQYESRKSRIIKINTGVKAMEEMGKFGVSVSAGLVFAVGNTLETLKKNSKTRQEKIGALITLCALVKANPDFIEITDEKSLEQLKILGQKAFEIGKDAMKDTMKKSQ